MANFVPDHEKQRDIPASIEEMKELIAAYLEKREAFFSYENDDVRMRVETALECAEMCDQLYSFDDLLLWLERAYHIQPTSRLAFRIATAYDHIIHDGTSAYLWARRAQELCPDQFTTFYVGEVCMRYPNLQHLASRFFEEAQMTPEIPWPNAKDLGMIVSEEIEGEDAAQVDESDGDPYLEPAEHFEDIEDNWDAIIARLNPMP